jgi:uroporphyrinogen-III synthase
MRLIVTRPAAQAAEWVDGLRARGLEAEALPLIGIAPPADLLPVQRAWAELGDAALVMFVSANAVEQFFAARPPAAVWPPALSAASTGPGTTAALQSHGVSQVEEPPADAPQFDSEALWVRLRERRWQGRRVWVVRGEEGRDWLAQQFQAAGAELRFISAYRRLPPTLDDAARALLSRAQDEPAAHGWLFSSGEAIGHLRRLAPAADWSNALALASHPRIADAAREAGFGRVELVGSGVAAVARHLAGS